MEKIGIILKNGVLFPQYFLNDLVFKVSFRSPVNSHQLFEVSKTSVKRISCVWNVKFSMFLVGEQVGKVQS